MVVAGWLGWKALRECRGAEAAIAAVSANDEARRAKLARLRERLAATERELAGMAKTSQSLSPGGSKSYRAVAEGANPSERAKPVRTLSDIIANDAATEVLMLGRLRGVVLLEYGPFFRARRISAEMIAKFQENYVKQAEQYADLRAVGQTQDEAGQQTVKALRKKAEADYQAAQAELLGAENYRLLKEFEHTLPVRNVVLLGLAGAAALEGVPLTTEQGERLVQAALGTVARDGSVDPVGLLKDIDWNALDERARGILSSEQFAIFRGVAVPAGFKSRWQLELEAAAQRAQEAEAAAARTKQPGR